MPPYGLPSRRSGRSLVTLWIFLTVATVGFALLLGGLLGKTPELVPLGTSALGFGALAFLFLQFWLLGTASPTPARLAVARPRPASRVAVLEPDGIPPAAIPVDPDDAPADVPLVNLHSGSPTATSIDADAESDLVEFELVPPESQAPTELVLPPAFGLDTNIEAAPAEPEAAWRRKELPQPVHHLEPFLPAAERRGLFLTGLPLVSSILAEEPAPVPAPTTERRGRTRGQCSGCQALLWAPSIRPIRLRCPKCGKVATLTS